MDKVNRLSNQERFSALAAGKFAAGLGFVLITCYGFAQASGAQSSGAHNTPTSQSKKHAASTGSAAPQATASTGMVVKGDKETEGFGPAQDAADFLRLAAESDIAFLAAGHLKEGFKKGATLDTLLLYPQDQLVVLKLTGAQVQEALERSVSLLPQPNPSFLQISGLSVSFSKSAPSGSRIKSVLVGSNALAPDHVYTVAMPSSLSDGGLGYFKVWQTPNIAKTLTQSIEALLKGKSSSGSASRWSEVD